MPTFESHDGANLHYDVLGEDRSGDPLVVLAGGAAHHPEYLGDLAGLDSVRTLVVLHQRGVGRSQAAPPASWLELAHDVAALRQHLGLDHLDLLGHSAGTRVAIAYAAAYPDTLNRLCLVTPPALWLVDAEDDRDALVEKRRGEPWFDDYEKARPALEAAESLEEYQKLAPLAAPLAWATWDDRARAQEALAKPFNAAVKAFFATAPNRDAVAGLTDVTAPVLVIAGAQDATTGLAPVVAMAKRFRDGHSVVIEGAGHFPWVEQPAAFRLAVDAFFGVE
jgi:pimeloyl-ACP methyl ester carboxylesterase